MSNSVLTRLNLKKHLLAQCPLSTTPHTIDQPDLTLIGTTPVSSTDHTDQPIYNIHKYDSNHDNNDENVNESTDTLLTTRTEAPRDISIIPCATPSNTNKSIHKQHKYDNIKSKLFNTTASLKLRAQAMKQTDTNIDQYKPNKLPQAKSNINRSQPHRSSITNYNNNNNNVQNDVDTVVNRFYQIVNAKDKMEHKSNDTNKVNLSTDNVIDMTMGPPSIDIHDSIDYDKHTELINKSMYELQQKKLLIEHNRNKAKLRAHYTSLLNSTKAQYTDELNAQLSTLQQCKQSINTELITMKNTINNKIKSLQLLLHDIDSKSNQIDTQYNNNVNQCNLNYQNIVNNMQHDIDIQMKLQLEHLDIQYSNIQQANIQITNTQPNVIQLYHNVPTNNVITTDMT